MTSRHAGAVVALLVCLMSTHEVVVGSKAFSYTVVRSPHDPVGDSVNVGDLHINTSTRITWVYYDGNHPLLGDSVRLFDKIWVERKDWDIATSSKIVPPLHPAAPADSSGPTPSAKLTVDNRSMPSNAATGTLTTHSLPVATHPSNKWMEELVTQWSSGPPSQVETQCSRGVAILEALLGFNSPIPRISTETRDSQTCKVIGKASRSGCPPSLRLAVDDIMSAREVRYSNSITNLEEDQVCVADFWTQQALLLDGYKFDRTSRLLVAFDIPSSTKGLGACRYSSYPYNPDNGALVSSLTNSWTFPGSITHPHMDGIACGMYIIHWRGVKLWLLWPPTHPNLRLMEHSMLTPPSIDTTVSLIKELEGLELLFLTDEELFEFAFCLYPNTIHCCLSFTESSHMGMPVRDISFLPVVENVFGWLDEWIKDRLIPSSGVCSTEKEQVVEKLQDALDYWKLLSDCTAASGDKEAVDLLVAKGEDMLAIAVQHLSLSK
ncbi:hypothetical protein H1R20_g16463, partial [Candolleomyces eurysporus]